MKKILLVEDDMNLSFMVKENLEDLGYKVSHIVKGEDVLQALETENFDLILMDVELPGQLNGFETAEAIRKNYPTLPIIFTTARNSGKDIQRGFGIDYMDYVKKPYGVKEVELRINSLLGYERTKNTTFNIGSFTFDQTHNILSRDGHDYYLANLESRFLAILCENIGSVVSKDYLIKNLIGETDDPKSKEHSLYNLIYKLRFYLKDDASVKLETMPKLGYQISVSEPQ